MLKLSLFRYFSLSTFLASFALYYAYLENEQFYPTVIYLTTNKLCVLSLGNFGLSLILLLVSLLVRIIFVRIEDDEQNEILQNTKFTIVEMCIALTSFRSDILSVSCVSLFIALLLSKIMHWLSKLRMENLARNVPMTVSKTRLICGLFVLLAIYLGFGGFLSYLTMTDGFSVYVLFAFEFLILGVAMFQQICRFRIITYDQSMNNRWEAKPTVMFIIEAIHDAIHLGLYIAFAVYVTQNWNFPLYLLREIYLAVQQLQRRVSAYVAYRSILRVFDTQFPTLTADEIRQSGRDLRCVICFEDMEVAKELPCRHCFHLSCLKGWFVQKQECPLCRKKVIPSAHNALAARQRREQLRLQREANQNQNQQQQQPQPQQPAPNNQPPAPPYPADPAVPPANGNGTRRWDGYGPSSLFPTTQPRKTDKSEEAKSKTSVNKNNLEEEKKDDNSNNSNGIVPPPPPLPTSAHSAPPHSHPHYHPPPFGMNPMMGGMPGIPFMAPPMPPPSSMMMMKNSSMPDMMKCQSVSEMRRSVERQTALAQMQMEWHRMCLNNAQFEFDSLIALQLRFTQILGGMSDADEGNDHVEQPPAMKSTLIASDPTTVDSDTLCSAANSTQDLFSVKQTRKIDADTTQLSPERRQMLEKRLQSFSHLEQQSTTKSDEESPKD